MPWAIVVDGQIIEVCFFEPETRPGERAMPLSEAIADGIPYA